jgi:hypothetical protein
LQKAIEEGDCHQVRELLDTANIELTSHDVQVQTMLSKMSKLQRSLYEGVLLTELMLPDMPEDQHVPIKFEKGENPNVFGQNVQPGASGEADPIDLVGSDADNSACTNDAPNHLDAAGVLGINGPKLIGDFFAGCGGFADAAKQNGASVACFAENDKDAKSMYLTAEWASSNLLLGDDGDITTIKPSDVPAVHMLTG